ncbi:MAG: hypothetical protein U0R44_01395 [Candidatus Micrarchaeia archaeon]
MKLSVFLLAPFILLCGCTDYFEKSDMQHFSTCDPSARVTLVKGIAPGVPIGYVKEDFGFSGWQNGTCRLSGILNSCEYTEEEFRTVPYQGFRDMMEKRCLP